ncbi:SCO4225 family membrane protein [Streptomyces sp. NPDC051567]|uniref:SCO4225 family membrane protein n=1 Tax=Streptomyces sp. NPDC051567 TaxID=3365660 RepID=UPI00379B83E8
MGRRRSKLEVWLPAAYLAVVVGLLVWVDVLFRTGDAGFAGIWPMLATAPLSLLAMLLVLPDPGAPGLSEVTPPVHTGGVPPEPLPVPVPAPLPGETLGPVPMGPPLPTDSVVHDLPGVELFDTWLRFGFYGVILACALVNATALWALVRGLTGLLARRRRDPGQA